jgi:hypothetical protein
MTIILSLPRVGNGGFKAMISCDPAPGIGGLRAAHHRFLDAIEQYLAARRVAA